MELAFVSSYAEELFAAFANPSKRVFWGFLLSSLVIAMVWCRFIRHQTITDSIRLIFSRTAWWSKSARADYKIMLINGAINTILAPKLLGQMTVALLIFQWMHDVFNGRPMAVSLLPGWVVMALFTMTLFVVDDFARYIVHRMLHRIPLLWSFHQVHHTATSLNPLTVYRVHPLEGVLFILRGSLVQGCCLALFVFFFGEQVGLVTVIGANVLNFAFNVFGSNLRHSHVSIGFWRPVERIFISPAQHQVHHSIAVEHHDKNFGVALAIWDLMFGTHCYSKKNQEIEFGLINSPAHHNQKLKTVYFQPFRQAFETVSRAIAKRLAKQKFQFAENKNLFL